jgi:hypothetical protein
VEGPPNAAPKLLPRGLPVAYFAFAHLALAVALLIVALRPGDIAGFFYHPRMFAVVHLITLGWITGSIFGATYLVAPFALRTTLDAGSADRWIGAGTFVGVSGIVTHFWIEHYWGLVAAGLLTFLCFAGMAQRVWGALGDAKVQVGVRLIVALAWANLQLAAAAGLLLGINKSEPFLPGSHFPWVFAHVHLAIVGWAVMMVVGVGYRLLPMFMPAAPHEGRSIVVCALLMEAGVLGLASTLPFSDGVARLFAVVLVGGLLVFFVDVGRMLSNPRRPAAALPRPDLGMLHVFQSLVYFVLSAAIGLYLLFTPDWQLGWMMAYGVLGLLGFLGQIVLGMGTRLLPMFAWTSALHREGPALAGPAPHELPLRWLQWLTFALWTFGVPALAWGLAGDRIPWVRAGAWSLGGAALLACFNAARILRHAYGRSPLAVPPPGRR